MVNNLADKQVLHMAEHQELLKDGYQVENLGNQQEKQLVDHLANKMDKLWESLVADNLDCMKVAQMDSQLVVSKDKLVVDEQVGPMEFLLAHEQERHWVDKQVFLKGGLRGIQRVVLQVALQAYWMVDKMVAQMVYNVVDDLAGLRGIELVDSQVDSQE